jgi:hypothetical protein
MDQRHYLVYVELTRRDDHDPPADIVVDALLGGIWSTHDRLGTSMVASGTRDQAA